MSLSVSIPVGCVEALSNATSGDEIIAICARWLPGPLRAERVSLSLLKGGSLVVGAMSEDGVCVNGERLDPKWSVSDRAVAGKQVVMVHAPDAQGSLVIGKLFDMGYRTTMVIPMISNAVVVGTLNLSSRREDAFDANDIRRCTAVAAWIGSQLLIRQYADRMERLAMIDTITGQANRRAFMTAAIAQMEAFRQHGEVFAVALFDLDHFKQINDVYGHETGDMVLETGTRAIADTLAPDQLLGRIGGEEFALLLPGLSTDGAMRLADRCREALAGADFVSRGTHFRVTASFGCTEAGSGDAMIDDVLRRADAALYAAKQAGRNRVHRAA